MVELRNTRRELLRRFRIGIGVLIWVMGIYFASRYMQSFLTDSAESNQQLVRFLSKPRVGMDVELERRSVLRVGDPIIVFEKGTARVVGNVIQASAERPDFPDPIWTSWARVEFYSSAPELTDGAYLSYHDTPDSMDWVVQMMLPPEKREEIGELIIHAFNEHHSEIVKILRPIILKSIRDAADVIQDEFQNAVAKREEEIRKLGERFQVELVEQELVPLLQKEILPIVQDEATPLATKIGEEMWQKASVWRFGWRIVYDQSPLPERNLVKSEFQRFLRRYGVPVIKSHLSEIVTIQQNILTRASRNKVVQAVVSDSTQKIIRDPEFQRLTADILQDVFVDNPRLLKIFEDNWNSEEAKRALDVTNRTFEPTVTRIGQVLFGSPQQSITPEFSRILRNRILNKDNRWLVLHRSDLTSDAVPTTLPVVDGTTSTENPFHVPARTEF